MRLWTLCNINAFRKARVLHKASAYSAASVSIPTNHHFASRNTPASARRTADRHVAPNADPDPRPRPLRACSATASCPTVVMAVANDVVVAADWDLREPVLAVDHDARGRTVELTRG